MVIIDTFDHLGVRCVIYPMSFLARLHLINTFDDIGINLVCRPLRYLHRFTAFLLGSDLHPDISSRFSLSGLEILKADAMLVASMSSTRTSQSGGRSGTSTGRRVSERGRIKKGRPGNARKRRSGVDGSLSARSLRSAERKAVGRINDRS